MSDVGLTRSGEEALILIKRVCATAPNLRGGNALKEPDRRFVKKFTQPDFWDQSFTQ